MPGKEPRSTRVVPHPNQRRVDKRWEPILCRHTARYESNVHYYKEQNDEIKNYTESHAPGLACLTFSNDDGSLRAEYRCSECAGLLTVSVRAETNFSGRRYGLTAYQCSQDLKILATQLH